MFPRCAMILQADSHDVSLVKNIIASSGLQVSIAKMFRHETKKMESVKLSLFHLFTS